MSQASRQRQAEAEQRRAAGQRQAADSPTPIDQPEAARPQGETGPGAAPPEAEQRQADIKACRDNFPAPPVPLTTVANLANDTFEALGHANRAAHILAKLETSGELTEAIDAIARARRLINARYLTGTPAKGG